MIKHESLQLDDTHSKLPTQFLLRHTFTFPFLS